METAYTFDDVLIVPRYSKISSRKDVDISSSVMGLDLKIPVFSANMDTITGAKMALLMDKHGAKGVLHRFMTRQANANEFLSAGRACAVSVGIGDEELRRVEALLEVGAKHFFIDVAHGAQKQVAEFSKKMRGLSEDIYICVGNFASMHGVVDFISDAGFKPDAIKIGVGPGSACTTRIMTGVGVPQLSAVMQFSRSLKNSGISLIADGGIRYPGDVAKALLAGADAVMIGGMLAGTDEVPVERDEAGDFLYRGSASKASYEDQGKHGGWRAAEGVSTVVPAKGSASHVLLDINGGLRSALTYVGAENLDEFRKIGEFVRVTEAGRSESKPHILK